ncbi:ATPase V [Erysipelothrix larvae]|uniref:ATP synthase F(0) sector subunit c n=1 Tax=Erysipelothrix larvae TaxID=1514105 RepID=A0A0X8H2C5_9FIRM|nr:ATP synthase subunit C [Erysipelothrix larvae]AMC94589.1 ATPase V [Erysipelothrix larvae]
MFTVLQFVGPLVLIALITLPLVPVFQGKTTVENGAFRVKLQIALFFASCVGVFLFSTTAYADTETAVDSAFVGSIAQGLGFIAASIAVGCSALGAGIAVAHAAPAAIGALAEKSDTFGKAMIFVALAEGVAIYGLLVAILIVIRL